MPVCVRACMQVLCVHACVRAPCVHVGTTHACVQAGGVGNFGTFGDITKAGVKVNKWQRVTVAVSCTTAGGGGKGEMKTWVGAEAGADIKHESITTGER